MKPFVLIVLFCACYTFCFGGTITGVVTDATGAPLPYASIHVKGGNAGTTANKQGTYTLQLPAGTYTIICQHIGYQRQEKEIHVADAVQLHFELAPVQLQLAEVVVQKGEDPAYEIIRQAIKKRPFHSEQNQRFTTDVYTKGLMRLRDLPKRFMGLNVEQKGGDTLPNKILFLSETIARYSVDKEKNKIEVLATKVSGQSDGFGLSAPQILSFYNNNVMVGRNLNPRGFVSPIADNAFYYYRYKYEGEFIEDGKTISKIYVQPRRKFEPLFTGYITIVENEWRLHSVQLELTKNSGMDLIDTLRVEQLHIPVEDIWVVQTQVLLPIIKMMGIDAEGSFVNVYSAYNLNPKISPGFFNNTYLKYTDSATKQGQEYWNTERPIALTPEEKDDYKIKDSLEKIHNQPEYLDSIDRVRNKVTVGKVLFTGQNINHEKKGTRFHLPSLAESITYNTVEGVVLNIQPTFTKKLDTTLAGRQRIVYSPVLRYGVANGLVSPSLSVNYQYGKKYYNAITIAGGKSVFQFNNNNPINELYNSISTLLFEKNYLKIYSAYFASFQFAKEFAGGFVPMVSLRYQYRIPLENSTTFTLRDNNKRQFTPNFPTELTPGNFSRHQSFITSVGFQWQPGSRYIELPNRKINTGSRYPVFSLLYAKAWSGILGSDVDYSKWLAALQDDLNLRLAGELHYRVEAGGFLNRKAVQIPDYTHFNGNQLLNAAPYLKSFQLAPYYQYSNTERFYTKLHVEYHLNGLLTNKIPLFRKLNWYLVTGTNTFYVTDKNYYVEAFAGLENILKILRVDYIQSYSYGQAIQSGVRIGINGALFGF